MFVYIFFTNKCTCPLGLSCSVSFITLAKNTFIKQVTKPVPVAIVAPREMKYYGHWGSTPYIGG